MDSAVSCFVEKIETKLIELSTELGVTVVFGGLGPCDDINSQGFFDTVHHRLLGRSVTLRQKGVHFMDFSTIPSWMDVDEVFDFQRGTFTLAYKALINYGLARFTMLIRLGLIRVDYSRKLTALEIESSKMLMDWILQDIGWEELAQ